MFSSILRPPLQAPKTTDEMPKDQLPPFATYILPSLSLPLRRRQAFTDSTASSASVPSLASSPTSSASTSLSSSPIAQFICPAPVPGGITGLLHAALQKEGLPIPALSKERLLCAQPSTIKCVSCASDLAFAAQIESKGFTGRHGRAYLVAPPHRAVYTNTKSTTSELVNTKIGRSVVRELLTGTHVVADVNCTICNTVLGWKYIDAKEMGQKYKIGKYILETKRVVVVDNWEEGVAGQGNEGESLHEAQTDEAEVVFDSEDEDECEDLFAGVWNAEVVAKRRSKRVVMKKKANSDF